MNKVDYTDYLARVVVVCVHSRLRFLSLAVFTMHLGISLCYTTMSFPAFLNKLPSLHQLFAFVTKYVIAHGRTSATTGV